MQRRAFLALTALSGCAAPPAPTLLPPPSTPRPPDLATRVRQTSWLTRFWAQLTPAQRQRVMARLRRGNPPAATTEAQAAPIWDALGLPDRDALVFGGGLPRLPPAADTAAL